MLLAEKKSAWSGAESLIVFNVVSLAVFVLPAAWGVRMLRRKEIVFPPAPVKADLNKKLAVTLSTFGTIMIIRILYASVFPSAVETFGVSAEMTATELFLVFVFSTVALAAAEEIFFRGFGFIMLKNAFRAVLVPTSAMKTIIR